MNLNKPEQEEFLDLAIGINAPDAASRRLIAKLLKQRQEDFEKRGGQFLIEGVSEQPSSFGAVESSFWVDLVMKVPVSIAVTVLSTWLCDIVKDARAKHKSSSNRKESIHIAGITVAIVGDEIIVQRKLDAAIEGEIRRKKSSHRKR
jgi:hypothetical protein